MNIVDVTSTKIPTQNGFCNGINRRQPGWNFMRSDGKITKIIDCRNVFMAYITRIKKEIPGVISEE